MIKSSNAFGQSYLRDGENKVEHDIKNHILLVALEHIHSGCGGKLEPT